MRTSLEVSQSLMSDIKARREYTGEIRHLSWGFRKLDEKTGGILPGRLCCLGAETGAGKSALLGQITLSVARQVASDERFAGKVVRVVHCEMTAEEFEERLTALMANVPAWKVRDGRLTDDEYRRIHKAASEIAKLPIEYLESPRSIDDTEAFIRKDGNCAWFAVDHLQIHNVGRGNLSPLDMKGTAENVGVLRELAKHVAPGLALSQLSNDVAKREDHRPNKGDLFGGRVTQMDFHVIMLLYRPDTYKVVDEELRDEPKAVHLIVDKARGGSLGDVKLWFVPPLVAFREDG